MRMQILVFYHDISALHNIFKSSYISGWWFGTCFIFPYIGNNHPNWRTHIFQRGRYTTNQICIQVQTRLHSRPGDLTLEGFLSLKPHQEKLAQKAMDQLLREEVTSAMFSNGRCEPNIQLKQCGYGSIPIFIPFWVGWTSINPSFDLGFTRYQGFDLSPCEKSHPLAPRFGSQVSRSFVFWIRWVWCTR